MPHLGAGDDEDDDVWPGQALRGRIDGWKAILNTLTITYGDRLNLI